MKIHYDRQSTDKQRRYNENKAEKWTRENKKKTPSNRRIHESIFSMINECSYS